MVLNLKEKMDCTGYQVLNILWWKSFVLLHACHFDIFAEIFPILNNSHHYFVIIEILFGKVKEQKPLWILLVLMFYSNMSYFSSI